MFDSVVISGGATKGYVATGVLSKYIKEIENVHTYVGCSVGAVIVSLLSMGASVPDIYRIGLASHCHTPTGVQWIGAVTTFFTKLGLIVNNTYLDEVERYVMERYGSIPTLLELYNITGKRLLICATAAIAKKRVVFSYQSHPDLTIIEALQMSIRMPIIFSPIYFENDLYIDGGMRCHFPIDLRLGRTLAIHTYNKLRDAKEMIRQPSIIEYIGLLLGCGSSVEIPNRMDGVLYDIPYERKNPLGSSSEEAMAMYNVGMNSIPMQL
jgi:NTE family protein